VVNTPWRWKWAWNGPDANGGIVPGKTVLPRNVQPVTGGGRVYIAAGARGVYALNDSDGSQAWQATAVGTVNSTVAYDAATQAVFVVSSNGTLYKLDAANGAIAGQFSSGQASTLPLPPAVIADRVFFSMGNNVYAINKSNLAQLWSYNAGAAVHTPPAYSPSRDRVIVVTADLYVHAIDNSNGAQAWRVKPTPRNGGDPGASSTTLAESQYGWPVVAEGHGMVLVKYRLEWEALWTWNPWPTDNASMRSNLRSRPDQQALFALSLDTGTTQFIANIGHGGWGDGGYLPMGPQPVVKGFADGSEVVYTVIRGSSLYDGRWDSKFGEMVLDGTTVAGFGAGDVRFIYYDWTGQDNPWPNPYLITDEQPFVSMAGDHLFGGHWMAGYATKIGDRINHSGLFGDPISTTPVPQIVNSSTTCAFSPSHYCATETFQDGDTRGYGPTAFYIYYNQPGVYDQYWSGYAGWVVSNNTLYFVSTDGAVVALENGNPGLGLESDSGKAATIGVDAQVDDSGSRAKIPSGPQVISYLDAREHAGEIKTVKGTIKEILNNGKAVYLGFKKPHTGAFVVRILKEDWGNFATAPEKQYQIGQEIQVTGKIEWYQGDPVIYVQEPAQIEVVRTDVRVARSGGNQEY